MAVAAALRLEDTMLALILSIFAGVLMLVFAVYADYLARSMSPKGRRR